MTRPTITFSGGRRCAIMRRHADGFEVLSLGEAKLHPGERLEVPATVAGRPAALVFVVGARRGRTYRLRAEMAKR